MKGKMEKIMPCTVGKKDGFKFGVKGKCHTCNKNVKSRRKAYEMAYLDLESAYRKRFEELENNENTNNG